MKILQENIGLIRNNIIAYANKNSEKTMASLEKQIAELQDKLAKHDKFYADTCITGVLCQKIGL